MAKNTKICVKLLLFLSRILNDYLAVVIFGGLVVRGETDI